MLVGCNHRPSLLPYYSVIQTSVTQTSIPNTYSRSCIVYGILISNY